MMLTRRGFFGSLAGMAAALGFGRPRPTPFVYDDTWIPPENGALTYSFAEGAVWVAVTRTTTTGSEMTWHQLTSHPAEVTHLYIR